MEVRMVWLGLDCMYRLLPLEEFDGDGSNDKR
jgi:hypothetical protein